MMSGVKGIHIYNNVCRRAFYYCAIFKRCVRNYKCVLFGKFFFRLARNGNSYVTRLACVTLICSRVFPCALPFVPDSDGREHGG